MEKFFTPFKVGLLVLVSTATLYYSFSEVRKERSGGYVVHAVLDDASELEPNSAVKIAGISVGEIKEIGLTEDGKAKVSIRMDDKYRLFHPCAVAGQQKVGAVASKTAASVLGAYYIELRPGNVNCPPLQDGEAIPNTDVAPSFDDITTQVNDILPEVKAIAQNLREVSETMRVAMGEGQGREDIKVMVQNLERIIERVDKTTDKEFEVLARVMNNVEGITKDVRGVTASRSDDLKETLDNIRAISSDIREFTSGAYSKENSAFASAQSTLAKLDSAADKLDGTLARAESISTKIDEGQGVAGLLINDKQTKESIEDSVAGASEFLQTFTRLHALVSISSEYKAENADTKLLGGFRSYINVRLQPRPDKFYEIESADDTGGVDRFTTEQTLDEETGEVKTVETLTRTDDFKFSFQMGLRWRNITFRAGIKDNTGGLGLDVHLLNDRLEIRNDFFEFASSLFALEVPRAPRWRMLAATPLPMAGFYLVGGIDELLNSPRTELGVHQRTWFMGIQFRFDDTDLKALFGFLPTSF